MMNADNDVTFSDMHISEQRLVNQREENIFRRQGYFLTKGKALLIFLAFLIICIIIGVSVHYATKCTADQNSMASSEQHVTEPPQKPMTSMKPPETYDVRLPTALTPVHYDLQLRPDIYADQPEDFTFSGSVNIVFDVSTSTGDIILHNKNLSIDFDSIKVFPHGEKTHVEIDLEEVKYVSNRLEFFVIPLKTLLVAGKRYHVEMAFTGQIHKDLRGIYYSSYVNSNEKTVYLLASQLQATDARKVFPCFDEPALKATFNISIDHKAALQTQSNTRIVTTETLQEDWIRDIYEQTPPMSTYLLAFLVSDFSCIQSHTANGTLIEVCGRPTAHDQTQYAMSVAVDLQEWFESYHDVPYPLSKMSHVAVPDFAAGAMENWGLIMYRETALLYDAVTAPSANAKQRVALIVAHELAHQWFGNLVTPTWWDDIWLNEGFASFMEVLGVDHIKDYNTWEVEAQTVSQEMQSVMVKDSLVSSHPVYQPVKDPAEINGLFDSITYDKGSAVIRMMRYFLGDKTFRWGISNYLKAQGYKAVDHEDLFAFLTTRSKEDDKHLNVTAIMSTWINQMGYPVVTFQFTPGDTEIALNQSHYLLDPEAVVTETSEFDYVWKVPVSYMSDKTGQVDMENLTITWLHTPTDSIKKVEQGTEWVLGNVNQAFYYRVNYNMENWKALTDLLMNNHTVIPVSSRAQLIDDSFQLGRSDLVNQLLGFNMTRYLDQEEKYAPWNSIKRNMQYIDKMLYQVDKERLLQKYMQEKVVNIYNKYSVDDGTESYTHLEKRLQALLWSIACRYELQSCLENATHQYQLWMNDQTYNINPNYAAVVYCNAIAQGDIAEWEFAYRMYMASNSGSQKDSLLSALGCSKTPWILQRYLEWALDEDQHGFGRQDMRRILGGVAAWPTGNHIAWSFFQANWQVYFDRFGEQSFSLSYMISSLTSRFSTEWEQADVKQFIKTNSNQGTAQRQFKQSLEEIETNIKWRNKHEMDILNWLKENLMSQ